MANIGRIKSNIQIMIDKGASEDEIDSYVSSEGVSLDQLQATQPPQGAPAPPIAGAGPDGADLEWHQPGYPHARPTPPKKKWYQADEGPYSSPIWPVSRDAKGEVSFDSDAGILGMAKRTVMLPGQVLNREIDPTSDEGMKRTTEAAMLMTPLGAASRVGKGFLGSRAYKQPRQNAPTREALEKATDAGYKKLDDLDVQYNSDAVGKMAANLERALNEEGFIPPTTGGVHALIQTLKGAPKDSFVKLSSLDSFRKRLGMLAGSPDDTVAAAATKSIGIVDDFIASANPSNLVAGAAPAANAKLSREAAEKILETRGNAAAGFRSDRVTGMEKTSARRTAAANSGRNADNNIRQRLTSLIESNKGSRGLSKAEETAIDDIIFGRPTKNAARYLGNLLGGGGGLGSTLLAGMAGVGGASAFGTMGAALSAIPPIVGNVARGAANRMSRRELKMLDELIRTRSPLHKQTPAAPVYSPRGGPEVMTRALAGAAANRYQVGPNGGRMIDGIEYF